MTNRDAAVLAFKVLGVWLIAGGILLWASTLVAYGYLSPSVAAEVLRTRPSTFLTLLPSVMRVAVGVIAWRGSGWLAARTFPNDQGPILAPLRGDRLLAVALSVIGVLLIVEALPSLANSLTLFGISREDSTSVLRSVGRSEADRALIWGATAKANTVASVVRLAIGLFLFYGPAPFVRFATRVRRELSFPVEEDDSPAEPAATSSTSEQRRRDVGRERDRRSPPRS